MYSVRTFYQSLRRLGRLILAQWPLTAYLTMCTLLSKRSGVRKTKRELPVIVSLTSHGRRLTGAMVCIETLLRQTVLPDRLILWLAHDEDLAGVAATLRQLEKRGLEVKRCDDWRSFNKIIPTIREFPHAVIVTADDDIFYPRNWFEKLLDAYDKDRNVIHCHRSRLLAFGDDGNLLPYVDWPRGNLVAGVASLFVFPTGVGGVLYPPGSLDARVVDHDLFMAICSRADDIWLKAMSLLANTHCRQTKDFPKHFLELPHSQRHALKHTNVERGGNDQQSRRVFSYFGLLDCFGKEFRALLRRRNCPRTGKDDAVQQPRNVEQDGSPAPYGTAAASAAIEGAISVANLQNPRALPRDLKAR